MKSNRTKACDIPRAVKERVWKRDRGKCIVCGSRYAWPNSHFIRRSQGGLGIEENIVTMCLDCHREYDQGANRRVIEARTEQYLKSLYPDWDREKLVYKKWSV